MRHFTKFVFSLNFLYLILIAAECAAIIFLCLYLPACLPLTAVFLAVWLMTLIAVTVAVCRKGSSEINCSLALFVVALPVAGAVIFLLANCCKKERGTLSVTGAVPQNGWESATYEFCGVCGAGYDRAVYFSGGVEYFTCLFREIERAQKSVYLEYFILSRGKIFSRLLDALRMAKRNGAEIRIIVDGIGSAFRIGKRELKLLRALGEVKIFHRLTPLLHSRLNFRDHRKIAVIDGKAAFTGGINLADEYANLESPYGYWKDTGVALYGAAAAVFEGMFLSVLRRGHTMSPAEGGKFRCLPFYDSPPERAGFCENAYISAIAAAKERVHVFTPYFCVGDKVASALAFAAMRGVDVRIILPHVPDKKIAFELSKTYALPLAAQGVKFYEYTPGFMHAKSMICDDLLFIGSYNFDFRSMRLNYECGVMLQGDVVDRAERDFRDSLRLSAPLKEENVRFPRRFVRFILKLFAPLV